jgi:hypothetical protein
VVVIPSPDHDPIIGPNGAYHWAGDNSGFAVGLLAAFAASWLSV